MKLNEQRMRGIRAAQKNQANETLIAIKNPNSCYEDILKVAIKENGLDAVVKHVLDDGPEMAYQMLRTIPNLGEYRDALIKKTGDSREFILSTLRFIPDLGDNKAYLQGKLGRSLETSGSISGFKFLDQAWYNCAFTMMWVNNGKQYPKTVEESNSKWVWSKTLIGGSNGISMNCTDFQLTDKDDPSKITTPLVSGNEVWIYMWVEAGNDIESAFKFVYDPNTLNVASFTATGSTQSTKLSLSGPVSPPA
ncbi:hypothetical protein [Patiriisocius marinus]|uniref:hypothetical protein n=1 Tax=Patiriisocius marinus TaxID=1397112 RepID=UPI00232DA55C|nr:hypothetical protein [Patiriisocius marinus]